MTDEDNPFARWSRRKRRLAEAERPDPAEPEVAAPAAEIPEPDSPEAEAELLERLRLPVPETLKAGDDFSAFMKAGVPEFLRKRALRVLWRSNPVLANLDGLNDYDDDFTSPELTRKVIATGYKIGRGFLREPTDPEILQENADQGQDDPARTAEVAPDAAPDDAASGESAETPAVDTTEHSGERSDEGEFSFHPRRMKFRT